MSTLMGEYEQVQRRRRRFALLVVLACVAGVGAWLSGPVGAVMIATGNQFGWALAGLGLVLLAGMVVAIVAAARGRVVPSSAGGKANPHFDEPEPSRNPVGGNGWIDSGIGSR
jgi:hypothetical protein